ncbi:hypothetical protein A1Q1_07044 [Trichosporon asahii var. asahii CBS 2479]|uniref:Uncharacterized protein n=1 Tax=Trichosporon asahii var. asahii (strain ATCC 90039 / CBS 2479 / JCM 2466 / KCTC 7840 / NBRC 103889/ NCYC 2677 / UAMH 7654) TaxID=1186058 RepID=J6F8I1_TRIAS|nr:hypothetical protein A1Q1_07044 [Trichosporon asahii var. asahii CBS 2479]EJT51632.1 hypothetical protein A1Q1_07044 [Trichosporon asahii var. asahii CBS 2479]
MPRSSEPEPTRHSLPLRALTPSSPSSLRSPKALYIHHSHPIPYLSSDSDFLTLYLYQQLGARHSEPIRSSPRSPSSHISAPFLLLPCSSPLLPQSPSAPELQSLSSRRQNQKSRTRTRTRTKTRALSINAPPLLSLLGARPHAVDIDYKYPGTRPPPTHLPPSTSNLYATSTTFSRHHCTPSLASSSTSTVSECTPAHSSTPQTPAHLT